MSKIHSIFPKLKRMSKTTQLHNNNIHMKKPHINEKLKVIQHSYNIKALKFKKILNHHIHVTIKNLV